MLLRFHHSLLSRFYLAVLLLFTGSGAWAQAPGWSAASAFSQAGTPDASSVFATALSTTGDVYLAGTFYGTITIGGTTLRSAGSTDLFVAKWLPASGSFAWAVRAGGSGADAPFKLGVGPGGVYLSGTISNPSDFGSWRLTPAGPEDGFIAKLVDNGTTASFTYTQLLGGSQSDAVHDMAVVDSGIYLAGSFSSPTAAIGSQTLANSDGTGSDGFVARLTDLGSSFRTDWAQTVGGTGDDYISQVAVAADSVYVVGTVATAAQVGPTTIQGSLPVFTAKLIDRRSSSSFAWALPVCGTNAGIGELAVSGNRVYLAGNFTGTVALGGTTFTNTNQLNYRDIFVAKIADAGTSAAVTWAVRAGGSGADGASALVVSGNRLYLAGACGYMSSFGSTVLNSGTFSDAFVAQLLDAGPSGSFTWAQAAGNLQSTDAARALALSPTGYVYVVGDTFLPASFGAIALPAANANAAGFVASFYDRVLAATAPQRLTGLAVYPNPAHSAATVRLPGLPGTTSARLTLRDALGRPVRITPLTILSGQSVELPLRGLAPGVYQVQVQAGTAYASCPLVVE